MKRCPYKVGINEEGKTTLTTRKIPDKQKETYRAPNFRQVVTL